MGSSQHRSASASGRACLRYDGEYHARRQYVHAGGWQRTLGEVAADALEIGVQHVVRIVGIELPRRRRAYEANRRRTDRAGDVVPETVWRHHEVAARDDAGER